MICTEYRQYQAIDHVLKNTDELLSRMMPE